MATSALSAGTITGDTVVNSAGEKLGTVEEIMIDLNSGHVAYVVLSAGGFLGLGEKYFAVPWSLITVDLDNHDLVVDLDRQKIENAPGFDKDNWPDTRDLSWLDEVYSYYGAEPPSAKHVGVADERDST